MSEREKHAAGHGWLFKTEPTSYSIDDLAIEPRQTTCWDGVRNYQARNMLRDEIKKGDRVLIYHSNAAPPAIVGTAVVVKPGYPDHTQWDAGHDHFDPKASPDTPRWFMVDVKLESIFERSLGLDELRGVKSLAGMELLRKGSRLSVQRVTDQQFQAVLKLADSV